MDKPPPKICAACGREMTWRKKWASNWDTVRFCSDACRRGRPGEKEAELERAIVDLMTRRDPAATGNTSICPSEVARQVGGPGEAAWRAQMESVRRAARRLAARGWLEFTQRGRQVDPSTARGPVRLRRRRASTA